MRAPDLAHHLPEPLPVPHETWVVSTAEAVVGIPPYRLQQMVRDTPSWALWDPGLVRVALLEGRAGEPGMVSRLTIGNQRWSQPVIQMLVATSELTTVFAGGGRRWRYIETIRLTPRGTSAVTIGRRVEVRLCGLLRWLRVPFRFMVTRHLRRSLHALT